MSELTLADRAVSFIERLTLTGDYHGQPFRLRPWQEEFVRALFATDDTGRRRIREAFLALPRKSGKTQLIAAILLFLLLGTGRKGQWIYSASGDRAQASLIFRAAATMIRNDEYLSDLCIVYDGYKRIECPALDSTYEALSSDAPLKHGLNPSVVLFDEVHVLPNRDLHDTLTSAFGARRDPLTIYITTAGKKRHSLCYELWRDALDVASGKVIDPHSLATIYAAAPQDDWTAEETWRKAMPALGDFCSLEFIRRECEKAQRIPSYENTFKQLYLNIWPNGSFDRWLRLDDWDACYADVSLDDYEGRECYAGLDLATIHDLSALVLIFPEQDGTYTLLPRFYAPREGVLEKERTDGVPYSTWAKQGHLTLCEGEVMDYDVIRDDVLDLHSRVNIIRFGSDPHNFNNLGQQLLSRDIPVEKYGQGFAHMNAPCKEFERLVIRRSMRHDGNPVMRYCVENVAIATDNNERIRPIKKSPSERIDGVVAAIVALGTSMAEPVEAESVYAHRGILVM